MPGGIRAVECRQELPAGWERAPRGGEPTLRRLVLDARSPRDKPVSLVYAFHLLWAAGGAVGLRSAPGATRRATFPTPRRRRPGFPPRLAGATNRASVPQ